MHKLADIPRGCLWEDVNKERDLQWGVTGQKVNKPGNVFSYKLQISCEESVVGEQISIGSQSSW